jgi:quercetin dioxygenase-like cupin family protein
VIATSKSFIRTNDDQLISSPVNDESDRKGHPLPFVTTKADYATEDQSFEPPYNIVWPLRDETCGSRRIMMARVVIPAGGGNQFHFHGVAEAFGHLIEGNFRNELGGEVGDLHAGDFWHFAPNEKHWSHNLSDTEPCHMAVAYTNCSNLADSRTTFLDPAEAPALSTVANGQLPEPGVYSAPMRSSLISSSSLRSEVDPETRVSAAWIATRETTASHGGMTQILRIAPGARHTFGPYINAEVGAYVVRGAVKVVSGDDAPVDAPAETYVYADTGEVVALANDGEDEATVYVVYAGLSHPDDLCSHGELFSHEA